MSDYENDNKKKYYSSGEFAAKAHVTLRTIRYYDQQNLLKPSFRKPSGARFYTDADFAKLQQILLMKYLGFSLDDIRELTLASADRHVLLESLRIQQRLAQERVEEMQSVVSAIERTVETIEKDEKTDWSSMLSLIHLTAMEQSLKGQYQNATNIEARIRLHRDFSQNRQGWFPWIMQQCALQPGMDVLEIGCGNGELWCENLMRLPEEIQITLSDKSEGMIHEVKKQLQNDTRFSFRIFDCEHIPLRDNSFDVIIANHVLFYCSDVEAAVKECERVLRPGGKMIAGTYGSRHMKEVTELVQAFNPEIVLSADHLYEKFGLENGREILKSCFDAVECRRYPDAIEISEAGPLISYILSCHGNQNRLLLNRYKEFREFVEQHTEGGFHITKDAGIFIAQK